jgi:hypothetical protein
VTQESDEATAPEAAGSATAAAEKATPSAQASRLRSGAVAQRSTSGGTGALDLIRQGRAKIARTVSLALATSSADFHDAADGVFDVVDAHNGFVRDSNVASGDPGLKGAEPGQAHFDLRIPAAQLEAATAELSDLGHVVSRTDGTRDITSSYVSTKRRIAAFEETRDSLLRQLEDAFTEAEQQSIKRRLRIVEAQLAAAQDQLGDIQRRVHFVPVAVTITADDSLGAGGGGGNWSVGDALDDAGRVLEVAAGVLVVSAAVLVPVGLVAIIGLLSAREIRRRQREAALD